MITLILVVWSLIAIGSAYGAWWWLGLALLIFLPKGIDRIVLYVWGGIALAALNVGGWLIVFCILAVIDIFSTPD